MSKHVRHIWAKANQHIKIHRHRPQTNNDNGCKDSNTLYIMIAIIVFIWIIM